jgi:L-fucose isomerase-like protein
MTSATPISTTNAPAIPASTATATADHVLLGVQGNRGFFPRAFAEEGATALGQVVRGTLAETGTGYVELGTLETWQDAKRLAAQAQRWRLDGDGRGCIGLVFSMHNFSDELGIRDFIRLADLDVPVLIHTEPDAEGGGGMGSRARRDGVCGRFSVCNALRHVGQPFTLTGNHAEAVASAAFAHDLRAFAATCRIAAKFRRRGRGVRLGVIGGGPDIFQTVTTVSTEQLGHLGLSTMGLDLLDLDRRMHRVDAGERASRCDEIRAYLPTVGMPAASLDGLARLLAVLAAFVAEHELDGLAVRCWSELQRCGPGGGPGISPCLAMSMLTDGLIPAACETDIAGWMGMYLLQTASGCVPSLGDWNNMAAGRSDEVDLFHCGVWAKSVLRDDACVTPHAILAHADPAIGTANSWGAVDGGMRPGTAAFFRPCTNARDGFIYAYGGVGEVLDTRIPTFGTTGRLRVPGLQRLFRRLTDPSRAVEHHTAVIVADRERIAWTMQGVRDAIPYLNHQAGRNASGRSLVEYDEHSRVEGDGIAEIPR